MKTILRTNIRDESASCRENTFWSGYRVWVHFLPWFLSWSGPFLGFRSWSESWFRSDSWSMFCFKSGYWFME